jgi:hypothetical protein
LPTYEYNSGGNGYNEPFMQIPWCIKEKIEVIPFPDSHKDERVVVCGNYERLTKSNL